MVLYCIDSYSLLSFDQERNVFYFKKIEYDNVGAY